MLLLDTNHCSAILNGVPTVLNRLAEHPEDSITICSIIMGELIHMAAQSERQRTNFQCVQALIDPTIVHPIDEDTAKIYGQLKAAVFDRYAPKDRKQRRRTSIGNLGIGDNDLWIAATAIQHHLTLVTADHDFARLQPLSDLAIDTWL
ncbi:MAG: type II toxin-antitoxin system VapC family toxin [Coleofasciculaceae cyanobacterium RL_1_1]|nr:type II toxin-antitoxin system VapC family toxin [Coleofasciculaceae cyanobacterium RL_1_1]